MAKIEWRVGNEEYEFKVQGLLLAVFNEPLSLSLSPLLRRGARGFAGRARGALGHRPSDEPAPTESDQIQPFSVKEEDEQRRSEDAEVVDGEGVDC